MPSIFRPGATVGVWPGFQPALSGTCIGGTRKRWALGRGGLLPDCWSGWSEAFSSHPPRTATQAMASTLRQRVLFMDEVPRGGLLHGNDDMADGQEKDRERGQPDA